MIVSLSVEQFNRLQKRAADTKYSANEIVEKLQTIYNTNFESDIDLAIEFLDDTSE